MIVIGTIGPKSAGKDEAGAYITAKYGGRHHSHSEILDDVLRALDLPVSRDNEIKLVALRDLFGENVLVNALNAKLLRENAEIEVISGIRFENEFDNIRSHPQSTIIYIDAPLETRYGRQIKINKKSGDGYMTIDEFKELETRITEQHIRELGAKADYKIANDGTLEEFHRELDRVVSAVLVKARSGPESHMKK